MLKIEKMKPQKVTANGGMAMPTGKHGLIEGEFSGDYLENYTNLNLPFYIGTTQHFGDWSGEAVKVWQVFDHDKNIWEDYLGSYTVTWKKFQSFFRTVREIWQAVEPSGEIITAPEKVEKGEQPTVEENTRIQLAPEFEQLLKMLFPVMGPMGSVGWHQIGQDSQMEFLEAMFQSWQLGYTTAETTTEQLNL